MISRLLAAAALALTLGASTNPQSAPHNPVLVGADPHMAVVCDSWWLYPTNATDPANGFQAERFYGYRSRDLVHWTRSAPLIDMRDIKWVGDDGAPRHYLWAPALAAANGRYYLYYSVGPQVPTPSRLGVAVGLSPGGPFRDSGRPLLTGGNGFEAIDPMVFVDPASGTPYLYAGGSAGATLRVFELKRDMTAIAREIAVATPPRFTEGVWMHKRGALYYLSYSHGHWNDATYSAHYATAPTPTGPWTYRGAFLTSDGTHQGPGHHAITQNPDTGEWFIAYHRWDRRDRHGPFSGTRVTAVERLRYGPDGAILPIHMTDVAPPASVIRHPAC